MTIPAQTWASQGPVIPSSQTQQPPRPILGVWKLICSLCLSWLASCWITSAQEPCLRKKFSPSFAKQSWMVKKKNTQIFKVSAQRMQSSEHKTAGGAGFVLPLPVADGKQENTASSALCSIPVRPPTTKGLEVSKHSEGRRRILM